MPVVAFSSPFPLPFSAESPFSFPFPFSCPFPADLPFSFPVPFCSWPFPADLPSCFPFPFSWPFSAVQPFSCPLFFSFASSSSFPVLFPFPWPFCSFPFPCFWPLSAGGSFSVPLLPWLFPCSLSAFSALPFPFPFPLSFPFPVPPVPELLRRCLVPFLFPFLLCVLLSTGSLSTCLSLLLGLDTKIRGKQHVVSIRPHIFLVSLSLCIHARFFSPLSLSVYTCTGSSL